MHNATTPDRTMALWRLGPGWVLLVTLGMAAPTAGADDDTDTAYTVRDQDTLWSVASTLRPDDSVTVQQMMLALHAHNPHAFGNGIDQLRTGATLQIPPAETAQAYDPAYAQTKVAENQASGVAPTPQEARHYVVQESDTLWSVARRLRPDPAMDIAVMARALFEANPQAFDNGMDNLRAGASLQVPETKAQTMSARMDGPEASTKPADGTIQVSESRNSDPTEASNSTPRGFTFGADRDSEEERPAETDDDSPWNLRVDDIMVEAGILGASDRPVDFTQHGRAVVSASRPLNDAWELRLGARADAELQQGGDYPGTSRLRADYDENYLRYRGEQTRFTIGTQRILWGRVDEIPPTDRLSTKDLTRFGLDDHADRRRANPAIRAEYFRGPWHVDLVLLPLFREAELPDRDSLWHPVDRNRGRLLGLPVQPELSPIIQEARLDDDVSGSGGGGVRLARSGRGVDFAATVQRARHSEPYYRFDDETRQAILAGGPPSDQPVLEAVHPRTWVVGGDAAFAVGAWTWRAEAAWLSDVPVTREDDLRQDTVRGVDWVVGAEGFPGDGDFRMTTQLAGQHLVDAGDVLDARDSYFLTGEFETPLAAHTWRASLRYSLGLNRRDVYLNPELAWIANEPMELYIGAHWLDGDEETAGGFYRANRMLVIGWRGQF